MTQISWDGSRPSLIVPPGRRTFLLGAAAFGLAAIRTTDEGSAGLITYA